MMCLLPLRLWSLSRVMFLPVAQPFFLHKACTLWYRYAGRDEVRRLNSESASAFKRKDDAYTCVKFVHLLYEGPRKVRRRRKRMECKRKNNPREDKTVSGKKFQCESEEELEGLLGPEDVDVDFRRILKEASDER